MSSKFCLKNKQHNTAQKTSSVTSTVQERTIQLVKAIDDRIITLMEEFVPVGSKNVSAVWHFSEFYAGVVGTSAIVSWLQSYVELKQELSIVLEDFAFFSVVLNDTSIAVKLAHGILLYYDALWKQEEEGKSDEKKLNEVEILKKTGWTQSIDSPLKDNRQYIDVCREILKRRRTKFASQLVAECVACRTKFLEKCDCEVRKPLNSMVNALLAPYFIEKNTELGSFLFSLFADILPWPMLDDYNTKLKRVLRNIYCVQTAVNEASRFEFLERVKVIDDKEKRKEVSDKLTTVLEVRLRKSRVEESKYVNTVMQWIRVSFFRYINNFLFYSSKLSILIHLMPSSLLFLNIFRLHMFFVKNSALAVFQSLSLENLVLKQIGGKRTDSDPAIICAPYCFNCGVFVDQVWPENHSRLEHTKSAPKGNHTFLCTCNMARYCSERCAQYHYPRHRAVCCGIPLSKNIEKLDDVVQERFAQVGTTMDGVD